MHDSNDQQKFIISTSTDDNFETSRLSSGTDVLTGIYLSRLQRTAFTLSGLPDGDEYVHVFGNGSEGSNLEAIGTLIEKLVDILREIPTTQHLEKVMDELSNRFHDLRYLVAIH